MTDKFNLDKYYEELKQREQAREERSKEIQDSWSKAWDRVGEFKYPEGVFK